jgi:hypothetical protein
MPELSNFLDTTSIEVFYQIAGVLTERILANCLYKIEDPFEIDEIVRQLKLKRLFRATQRKATNWLIFRFKDNTHLMTDLDEEADELRVTTEEWIQEYRISEKASSRLNQHIQKARPLYEKAYK